MSDPYYRWFPGDYIRDTGTLTLLEHGVYQMMLNYYYVMEGLPSNVGQISFLLRSKKRSERVAINSIIGKYFDMDGERLINKRADAEIAKRKEFLEKQRVKGKQSAEAKKANHGSTVVQPVFQPEVNLPSLSPSPLEERSTPIAPHRKKRTVAVPPVSWDRTFSGITPEMTGAWSKAYPACDIAQHLYRMDQWLLSNPAKAKKKNYYRFITNWLSKAQEKGGR